MVTSTVGLVSAAVVAVASQAGDPDRHQGFYVTVSGIGVLQSDSDVHALAGPPLDATLDYDIGLGAQIGVGYTFVWPRMSLSLQADYAFRSAELSAVNNAGSTSPASGTNTSHSLMISAIAEIYLTDNFGLYAGGGLGATLTHADLLLDLGGPPTVFPSEETIGFSWQFMGGVQFAVSDRVVIYGGVTYFDAGKVEFNAFNVDNSSLGFVAGLRLYF